MHRMKTLIGNKPQGAWWPSRNTSRRLRICQEKVSRRFARISADQERKLVVCIREIASEQSKLCQQNIGLGTIYLLVNHLLQPTRTGFYAHSDFLSGCEMVLAFQICVVPRKSAAAFPAFKLRTRVALHLIPRNRALHKTAVPLDSLRAPPHRCG